MILERIVMVVHGEREQKIQVGIMNHQVQLEVIERNFLLLQ